MAAVSLRAQFELAGGAPSPAVLKKDSGWQFEVAEVFIRAKHAKHGEYLIPVTNVTGIHVAPAIPVQAPTREAAPETSAKQQPVMTGQRRAGARAR